MPEERTKVSLEDRSLACTLTFEERERKGTELARASAEVDMAVRGITWKHAEEDLCDCAA